MGCAPSNLATSSSTAAVAAATNTTATNTNNSTPASTGMEKDGSLFFCLNFRRTSRRRCSQLNGQDGSAGSGGDRSGSGNNINADELLGGTVSMCNQALLNPSQTKNEADYDKMSSGKKDSIVTVAALGNFTHHVVRRATGSTGTSGTSSSGGGSRPGHRKSSLALTPEDETMDSHQVRYENDKHNN